MKAEGSSVLGRFALSEGGSGEGGRLVLSILARGR